MSKLYFFYSAMNAGKTTHLLQKNYNFFEKDIGTLLFIPFLSSNQGIIKSRIGLQKSAIVITNNFNIFIYVKNCKRKIKCVFVDEVQFLTKKHIFELISIVDILKISVYAYGLRTDFKSKLFESSKYLLAFADNLIELNTICFCGRKAILNARLKDNKRILYGNQIEVDKKKYISLCRFHYYNMNKL